MAKSHNQSLAQEIARLKANEQRNRTMDPAARADLDRRKSGAAGTHGHGVRRGTAGGRTTRVGSRSSQRHAAVRDYA